MIFTCVCQIIVVFLYHYVMQYFYFNVLLAVTSRLACDRCTKKIDHIRASGKTGNRKPESGIGTGMGTGTGTGTGNSNGTETAMWRGTDTRTGILFTLNYFNSNSIYTENKNTTLVSCSPPNLFIIQQRGGRKSRKLNK